VTALIVAAAAERAGLILLHQDEVYERIASVTGQPLEPV
jgi:predicted nucleic acid-binding protein